MESLKWCGIEIDEGIREGGPFGPYRQSERKDIYVRYADKLVNSGWAYYAFDTPAELDEARKNAGNFSYDSSTRLGLRNSLSLAEKEVKGLLDSGEPYVIRFKFPENNDIVMQDLIRGEVHVNFSTLDDKVLFKSDGLPTYHLANVVDDHLMEISHVIRGEEWLPSLPLHFMLYKALGWADTMPQFAHLPLILKPTGSGKLSKRDGDKLGFPVFPIEYKKPGTEELSSGYRESGYLPEAFINMLALLGWNPGTEQEIFSMEELINIFSLERVGKSGSRFDPEKSRNINQHYIQQCSDAKLSELIETVDQEIGRLVDRDKKVNVIKLVKDRMNLLTDFSDQAYFFFEAPSEYDAKMTKKGWKEGTKERMEKVISLIQSESGDFSAEKLEISIKDWAAKKEIGLGMVMNPLRLALVGAPKGPGVFDIMEVLGSEETVRRINKAIDKLG
jgi:glutamyl-tRNA synthetase